VLVISMSSLRCTHCGTVPDWDWRWCPDCGGALEPVDETGDRDGRRPDPAGLSRPS
jgi:rRNA maturation endonuclease Nob1